MLQLLFKHDLIYFSLLRLKFFLRARVYKLAGGRLDFRSHRQQLFISSSPFFTSVFHFHAILKCIQCCLMISFAGGILFDIICVIDRKCSLIWGYSF